MTRALPQPSASPMMPREHLAQLDQIDQRYWWHRVRWRVVRHGIRRFRPQRRFSCYFDIGSGGGGLPGLLMSDFAFDRILLFDHHPVDPAKVPHPNVTQQVSDLERFDIRGLPAPQLITCLDVLEHLSDPGQLLRGLRAASRGEQPLLIVTVPAMPRLWSSWDTLAGHHRRYDRPTLQQLLEGHGWQLLHCAYLFHLAVVPLALRRRWMRGTDHRLEFPQLPPWVNRAAEWGFWSEYLLSGWCRLPFGSSLIAVAESHG